MLLQRGRPVQKLAVFGNLPQLYAAHGVASCAPLLSIIVEETPGIVRAALNDPESADTAVAEAQALRALAERAGELRLPDEMLDRQLRACLARQKLNAARQGETVAARR